jgi:hypothetical protein
MRRFRQQYLVLGFIQALIGFVWLKAAWEKLSDASYANGMSHMLAAFASKNPFGWYSGILHNLAIPNATTFAVLVEYGELLAGLGVFVVAFTFVVRLPQIWQQIADIAGVVALVGAAFLSANFWFAAGWMSSSTDGENMVLFFTELALAVGTLAGLLQVTRRAHQPQAVALKTNTAGGPA